MRFLAATAVVSTLCLTVYAESDGDEEGVASAEGDQDSSYQTEVRGRRILPTDATTSFAETIDVSEGAESSRSVSDVLSEATGVQVRRLGGLGSYGSASIRGSTPNQVPILLDGIVLNAGGFPSVNLGDLDLNILESIELYRGSAPISLGAVGIGGAVSLKTRRLDEPVTEAAAALGSWGTYRLMLQKGDRIAGADLLAIATVQGSEGDFEYLNRNGTPLNEEDDLVQRRRNNRHVAYGGLVKIDGKVGSSRWTAINDLFAKRQGVPGIDSVPTDSAELRTLRNLTGVRLTAPLSAKATLGIGGDNLVMREEFDDSQNEIGVGYQRTVAQSNTAGGDALLELKPVADHDTALGVGAHFDRFSEKDLATGTAPGASTRIRANLGLQHEWRVVDAISAVPAFRLELHRARFGGGPIPGSTESTGPRSYDDVIWSPSLGVRWELVDGLVARANGGRYARAPDLTELFGNRGSIVGNPDLNPETGINADAGLTYLVENQGPLSSMRADAAWFGSRADDLIAYVQNSQNTIRPENIDAAEILGVETSLRLLFLGAISFLGNYTYLYGINRSDKPYHNGKRLPGRPAHEAYGRIEACRAWREWSGGAWIDLDYAGNNYLDQANLREDALARLLFGVGYRVERPREGLTLALEIKNLFDTITVNDRDGRQRPLRDFEGFPLPGRTLMVTLHWKR